MLARAIYEGLFEMRMSSCRRVTSKSAGAQIVSNLLVSYYCCRSRPSCYLIHFFLFSFGNFSRFSVYFWPSCRFRERASRTSLAFDTNTNYWIVTVNMAPNTEDRPTTLTLLNFVLSSSRTAHLPPRPPNNILIIQERSVNVNAPISPSLSSSLSGRSLSRDMHCIERGPCSGPCPSHPFMTGERTGNLWSIRAVCIEPDPMPRHLHARTCIQLLVLAMKLSGYGFPGVDVD